jgi:capsular polysaccharide export protein
MVRMRALQRSVDFLAILLQLCIAMTLSRYGKKVVFSFCVDAKKTCIIGLEANDAIILGGRIHKKRLDDESLPPFYFSLLRPFLRGCESRGIVFYVWGYADKQFFSHSFSDHVKTFRLETGLFGVGAKYGGAQFAYVIDSKAPYFDGRSVTDLETLLSQANAGCWERDPKAKLLIERIALSKFQKYAEINGELKLNIAEGDVVVVGQCAGDAAWIETDSRVTTNVDLVDQAKNDFRVSRIFYKPHPFNRTNNREIEQIERSGLAKIVPADVSFSEIAARRPVVVVNTSGAGLEAALRGCTVHTYGTSYYSHWGFTKDRTSCPRRTNRLTPQDVFYVLINQYCKYGQRKPLIRLPLEAVVEQVI